MKVKAVIASSALSLLAAASSGAAQRHVDTHPDLSGNWEGATGGTSSLTYPHGAAPDGSISVGIMSPEQAAVALKGMQETGPGKAVAAFGASTNVPVYRTAELQRRADELWQHGNETDKVVVCGQPGLPRVGAPLKIIQTAGELTFLYADPSGMAWRIIPTDGRGFRERVDPSYYGDSVGRWEGDTLVVETRNLSTDTWFGEYGYFHSEELKIVERLRRDRDLLTWQVTVSDPQLLAKPWVKPAVIMHRTDRLPEEPYPCVSVPSDAGHHEERIP